MLFECLAEVDGDSMKPPSTFVVRPVLGDQISTQQVSIKVVVIGEEVAATLLAIWVEQLEQIEQTLQNSVVAHLLAIDATVAETFAQLRLLHHPGHLVER